MQTATLDKAPSKEARHSEVKKMFEKARKVRRLYENRFRVNESMYYGQHWKQWDADRRLYVEIPETNVLRKNRMIRQTINMIFNGVNTDVAMMMRTKMQVDVQPNSMEGRDRLAADTGRKLLSWYFDKPSFAKTRRTLHTDQFIYGTGFLKVYHDELAPRNDINSVKVETVNPFGIFPCNYARSPLMEDLPWFIHARTMHPDEIAAQYGEFLDGAVLAPDSAADDTSFMSMFRGDVYTPSDKDFVTVYELWQKPTIDHPDGRFAVWTAKQLIMDEEELPYKYKDYFLVKFDDIVCSGRFWGESKVTQKVRPQIALNIAETVNLSNLMKFGMRKWLIEVGSLVKDISDETQNVEYRWGHQKPEMSQQTPLDPMVFGYAEQIMRNMDALGMTSSMSTKSTPPKNTRTFRSQMAFLEQDELRLSPQTMDMKGGMDRTGKLVLELVQEKMTTFNLIKISDASGYEVMEFRAADLKNNTDVNTTLFSQLGISKADRIDAVFNLIKVGALDLSKPAHRRYVYTELNTPMDEPIDPDLRDRKRAIIENLVMLKGEAAPVRDQDNDDLHLEEHLAEMVSQHFIESVDKEKLGGKSKILAAFQAHKDAHEKQRQGKLEQKALDAATIAKIAIQASQPPVASGAAVGP